MKIGIMDLLSTIMNALSKSGVLLMRNFVCTQWKGWEGCCTVERNTTFDSDTTFTLRKRYIALH